MKKSIFSIVLLAVLFIASTAFAPTEKAAIPDVFAKDFLMTIENADLADRFELQFGDIIAEVSQIDAHRTELGDYYYTIYGQDANGQQVVDYFKTTEAEVQSETYNYIAMTERTMEWPRRKKCREAITFPFPGGTFCHPLNPGYICGIEVYPNGPCFLY